MENTKTMKSRSNLAALVLGAAFALSGCTLAKSDKKEQSYSPSKTPFVETAKGIEIKPHYGADHMFMDGIVLTKYVSGDGNTLPNTKISEVYLKGTPEYDELRPLLTVEREK